MTMIGAGQKASIVNGVKAAILMRSWGRPRLRQEPVSQTIALLQGERTRIWADIEVWSRIGATSRVSSLEREASDILDYLDTLYPIERRTEFSNARDADHYEALMSGGDERRQGSIDYEAIKARVDIVDFIGQHVPLRPQGGGNFSGVCPFHQEKTPSFVVYPDHYFCFGCGATGTVIELREVQGHPT